MSLFSLLDLVLCPAHTGLVRSSGRCRDEREPAFRKPSLQLPWFEFETTMSKKRDNRAEDDDGVFEWRRLVAFLVAAAVSAADGASALSSFSHLH